LRILLMLSRKKLCVCEIQAILGVTVSTVSKHLSILKEIGLIFDEKDGKWINYTLNKNSKDAVLIQLLLLIQFYISEDELVKSDLKKVENICRNKLSSI